MSIEKLNTTPMELQALHMAKYVGIELAPEQIVKYVQLRQEGVNHQTPESSVLGDLSDQRLLDKLLTPEQRSIFRLHYPNIFQTGS